MSKTSHTPGPWHNSGTEISGRDEQDLEYRHICSMSIDLPLNIRKANAALISAVPDLLEALKLMVGYPGQGKSLGERLDIANQAIAKATKGE